MDAQVKAVMIECTEASDQERVTFPEVVMKLMKAGVERYDTDLIRAEKTYYLPNGESLVVNGEPVEAPAQPFLAAGVDAAVRAIQAQKIQYREFCQLIARAGCVGYQVSLAGRRAVYYGRTGESHVELFPGSK